MPEAWVSSLPRSSRLEDEMTDGRVVLILDVTFDAMQRSLELTWASNPESLSIDGRISFGGLTEFAMTFDDEFDADCMADLIGLDEYLDAGFSRYVVHTTDWELVFTTAQPPPVSRLG